MWQAKIKEEFFSMRLLFDHFLSAYTYTKTGGKADVIAFPKNKKEVKELMDWANQQGIPITVLGNASNVIVDDGGIKGIVMLMDKVDHIIVSDTIKVGSGVKLIDLAKYVSEYCLTGLEFACGIPGSVGGAIFMNAGAYGGEIKDVVVSVDVITQDGQYKTYSNEEMNFAYRQSIVQKTRDVIVSVDIRLERGDKQKILQKMAELTRLREEKQPLEYPSCGSVFKRPEGYFAGKLIQDAKLQGVRIGGVEVSKKHAGFMVNIANGTANDYKRLISHVQQEVFQQFGVLLETEVKFIGETNE